MLKKEEAAIASSAIDYIFNYNCFHLSNKELQKLLIILNLTLEKLEEKIDNFPSECSVASENKRKALNSEIFKINSAKYAASRFLECSNENEKYICFNDIVRKSVTSEGHRYNSENTIVFPLNQIGFALIGSNHTFDKVTGRKERNFYSPVQIDGNCFVKREVPNGEFSIFPSSNEIWKNKYLSISERILKLYTEIDITDFYEMYMQDMLKTSSDIISEYFSRPETVLTITRPELGLLYYNCFISRQ